VGEQHTDASLDELRREIRYVRDRLDVLDCVHRQARGHDRHDVEIMTDVYWPDGIDEHGSTVNLGPDYGAWANRTHAAAFEDHLHNITTHTCEIDGDTAHCESYVFGAMRTRDGKSVSLLGGRYLDRLERRDGVWRIAVRRCTIEWSLVGDASLMHSGAFAGFLKGTWDHDDLSYARPLTADSGPAERW
jgi:hypothetical protein